MHLTPKWQDDGVRFVSCPDLEPLLDAMADRLREPLADPFAEEIIVVPSNDIAQYLKRELGKRLGEPGRTNGIVANVRFVYPRQLVNATPDDPVGILDSPWDAMRLTWRISSLLSDVDIASLPRAFSVAPLAASRRTADLFDRYASHRPELLAAWARGHVAESADAESREWQVEVYRRVADSLRHDPTAQRTGDRADSATGAAALPQRITAFGIDSLSRAALAVLSSLGKRCDVVVYWAFPVSDKSLTSVEASTQRVNYRQAAIMHPLTSRWSAHAIESTALLGDSLSYIPALVRSNGILHRIQTGIITDAPLPAIALSAKEVNEALLQGDGSIQIHACYGLYRQAEALRDSLLHILNADPDIRLRDILVVCGDVQHAAPVLNAVFDPEREIASGVPKLPINVLRGAAVGNDDVTEAFLTLLNVLTGRFSVGDVTDLASLAPISRKFSFDIEALDSLSTWTEQMRVKYGLTAESRTTLVNAGLIESGTWAAAIERLMMGIAVPAETDVIGPGGVVPFDGIASSDFDVVGNVVEFLSRLEQSVAQLKIGTQGDGLSLLEWRDALLSLLDTFIEVPRDAEEQAVRLRGKIHTMYRESAAHPELADRRFDLRDLRLLADEYLRAGERGFGSRFEAITVTEFGGLDHLPYKVIAFLGADEKVFAGARADGDDILSLEPRVGEPIYSLRGRNHLLNLLLAARRNLIITCTGSDVRSNKELQLAVPVRELMEHVAAVMSAMPDVPSSHRTYVRHPRHNFGVQAGDGETDPNAPASPFEAGAVLGASPFTFDANALRAQRAIADARSTADNLADADELGEVLVSIDRAAPTMTSVHKILRDPITFFYEDVLNVDIPKVEDDSFSNMAKDLQGDGVLNLTMNALERSSEGRMLLRKIVNEANDSVPDAIDESIRKWQAVRPRSGVLPPGALGQSLVSEIAMEIRKIIEVVRERVPSIIGADVDCDVLIADQPARLRVENVVHSDDADHVVRIEYKRPAQTALLTLWADIAALTVATGGHKTILGHFGARPESGDGTKKATHSVLELKGDTPDECVEHARRALNAVSELFTVAHQRPVPLFPSASPLVARAAGVKTTASSIRKVADALTADMNKNASIKWFIGDRKLRDLLRDQPEVTAVVASSIGGDARSEMEDLAADIWGVFYATTTVEGYGSPDEKPDSGDENDNEASND